MQFATLTCAALSLASCASALPKISRVGRYLYSADQTRFFIKGIAYQESGGKQTVPPPGGGTGASEPAGFIDPLADAASCARDIPNFQSLGINTIRVYNVDPTLHHDTCMAALSTAGVYTIVDLGLPGTGSINRDTPLWTTDLLNAYLRTVDAFRGYDNVLAFTVGNEVVTMPNNTNAAPFVKAAARDVNAYLKSKGSSALVTYASEDGSQWRNLLAQYLACDSDADSIDLFGLNNYEWVGTPTNNPYTTVNSDFQDYNIPAYFSEFGSNGVSPRPFTEVAALFGSSMTDIWSGGLAFGYFPAASKANFELVTVNADGTVTTNTDFANLKAQFAKVTFATTPAQADAGATQFPACAAPDGVNFLGVAALPPTPDQAACDCAVQKAFSCTFTNPETNLTTLAVTEGQLLTFACGLLGAMGGASATTCNQFSASGSSGTYGALSSCGLSAQTSAVFSAYYDATNRVATSCSFGGNATINSNAPPVASVAAAQASCLSAAPATFTPTGPAVPTSATSTSGSAPSPTKSSTSGAFMNAGSPELGLRLAVFGAAVVFSL